MSSVSINQTQAPTLTYERLLGKDITRLPDQKKVSRDIFVHTNKFQSNEDKKNNFIKKAITMVTCAIVALGLAHRNNLFNPVRRETAKILKNESLQKKVKQFVDEKISSETYINATKKFLNKLISDKKKTPEFVSETRKILNDEESFKKLFEKVQERLADDKNPETLKQGFAADLLDRLFIKVEKDLAKNKENSLPFKNQGEKIINDIFTTPHNGQSTVEELLYNVINNRTSSTIENYINTLAVNAKLGI